MKEGDIINANLKLKVERSTQGCKHCYFNEDGRCSNNFEDGTLECIKGDDYFNFVLIKEEVTNDK